MTVNVFFRALKVAGRIKDFCSRSDVLLVFLCPFSSFLPHNPWQIWESIKSGAALENPMLLNRFLLLTFAVSGENFCLLLRV